MSYDTMVFTNVKYFADQGGNNAGIIFTLNGEYCSVAVGSVGNKHYDEIMKQVDAGTLTIQDADNV